MDFILNGQGSGVVADKLIECNGDTGVLRPYIGKDGRQWCTMNIKGIPTAIPMVGNATTTMRQDDWKLLDEAIVKVARPRLKAVADLRGAGLTFNIPNGMAHTVLQTETQSDENEAEVSMDGMKENANDRPEFKTANIPLPIIHRDFNYSARNLMVSRNGGSPLDTTSAETAARKVAEQAEKMLIGNATTGDKFSYGGGVIYGYTDFPSRLTKTFTNPTASGWTGTTLINELLAATKQLRDAFHYGPYVLYTGTSWQQYLGNDFKAASDKTLQSRVEQINEISSIRPLDYLSGFDLILVQLTSDVVREIIGMDITTVQWDSHGGMQKNFKVMAIMVPQLRADFNSNTGILHGSV
jgi:uncharacterized linocin/CFP29 family protein